MQRTITIEIILDDHCSKLNCSLGVDVKDFQENLSEEQKIVFLLTSLCDAFQLYPRGLYANISN